MGKYYKCSSCGTVLEECEIEWREWNEYHGNGIWEPWAQAYCPFCGEECGDKDDEISENEYRHEMYGDPLEESEDE